LLWNVRTGDPEGAIDLPGRSVDFVATVPGKQVLATRASDGTVYTHDLARRTEPVPIAAHPTGVQVLSLSPDGQLFVTEGTDDSVRLWETATGNPLFSFRPTTTSGVGKSLGYCVFSPDGQTLAVRRGNEVHLLDIASKSLRILATRHSSCVRSLAYSPDGTILATGGDERLIKFFDTSTWQERAVLVGHHDPVTALAFSPDGKTLASGGETGEVRLWDVFTTEELFSLPGHTGTVWCVAFSPDGTCLATGGVVPEHTGETILWRAPRNKE
jgi:WD40 repeat protein